MTEELKKEDSKQETTPAPEVKYSEDEQKAMQLGWKPKDQWEGEESDWVSAKWWLKFGEVQQRAQIVEVDNKQKDRVIKVMKDHHLRVKDAAKAELLANIRKAKVEAKAAQDFERVADLDEQEQALQNNLETRFKNEDAQLEKATAENTPPPEFYEWNRANTWYKLGSNDEMTNEADQLAYGYRFKHPQASYAEILKHVTSKIQKLYPDHFKQFEPPPTAVDDGPTSRAAPKTSSKSRYNLSEAEKAAAKTFGMTEEEYAKELQAYDKRKGF